MSMHIVDNEQRCNRRITPMRPLGSSLAGISASLALLDDVQLHRLRRAASHLPARRSRQNAAFIHYQALSSSDEVVDMEPSIYLQSTGHCSPAA
jgi:hypothetical protein